MNNNLHRDRTMVFHSFKRLKYDLAFLLENFKSQKKVLLPLTHICQLFLTRYLPPGRSFTCGSRNGKTDGVFKYLASFYRKWFSPLYCCAVLLYPHLFHSPTNFAISQYFLSWRTFSRLIIKVTGYEESNINIFWVATNPRLNAINRNRKYKWSLTL